MFGCLCVVMVQTVNMQIQYGAIPEEARSYQWNNPATHQLAAYLGIDPPGDLVQMSQTDEGEIEIT